MITAAAIRNRFRVWDSITRRSEVRFAGKPKYLLVLSFSGFDSKPTCQNAEYARVSLLAVHVCDWRYVKALGHARATDADKGAFGRRSLISHVRSVGARQPAPER
jgi:hypothetical protein